MHLGVDPGGKGAWALLDAKGALVASEHLPLDGEGFVDAAAHIATWRALGIERATIERVGSFTRVKGRAMGIKGRFNFGFNAGVPRSVLQILGVPFDRTRGMQASIDAATKDAATSSEGVKRIEANVLAMRDELHRDYVRQDALRDTEARILKRMDGVEHTVRNTATTIISALSGTEPAPRRRRPQA